MSLSLYNMIGVIEGYLGRKSPFVRTPKFNIHDAGDDKWKKNKYLSSFKGLGLITWLEAAVIVYFSFGFVLSIQIGPLSFAPFYAMLLFGFSYSLVLTIRQSSYAK